MARRYGLPRRGPIAPDPEVERLLVRDLAARAGDLGGSGEVSFRVRLGLGRVGDHILEIAEEERAHLVAVGTHHRHGLGRLASVASVALHFSHASVAAIPVADGPLAPAETPRIRSVLVATDLSPLANYAVPWGYALLGESGGQVFLLHVATSGEDAELLAQLRALVPAAAAADGIVTRTELVRHEDAARAICEAAERLGADAVCLTSHGRSGWRRAVLGSVAEVVARESHRPVLIVRPPPA